MLLSTQLLDSNYARGFFDRWCDSQAGFYEALRMEKCFDAFLLVYPSPMHRVRELEWQRRQQEGCTGPKGSGGAGALTCSPAGDDGLDCSATAQEIFKQIRTHETTTRGGLSSL